VNVDRKYQEDLSNQYSDIEDLFSGNKPEKYKSVYISVFEHWLSDEEAQFNFGPDISPEIQHKRNLSFEKFAYLLLKNTDALTCKSKGRGKSEHLQFKAFTSFDSAVKYTKPAIEKYGFPYAGGHKGPFFNLILPKLFGVYLEGYDDTNVFYYKHDDTLKLIEKMVSESGLYCLY